MGSRVTADGELVHGGAMRRDEACQGESATDPCGHDVTICQTC